MLDNIEEMKIACRMTIEEDGLDPGSKADLISVLKSNDKQMRMTKPSAALLLHGLVSEGEVQDIEKYYDSKNSALSVLLFASIAGTLEESGQEYFNQKLRDNSFPFKHAVFYAIQKYGDGRFIKPALDYLLNQMQERPTQDEIIAYIQGESKKKVKEADYLRNLSDILAILVYLKRVDAQAYEQAVTAVLANEDRLEARERRWLRDNHGLSFESYR